MAGHHSSRPELDLVLQQFPEQSVQIRRNFLASESFRELCVEFVLACRTLDDFDENWLMANPAVVPEYEAIIADLRSELISMLESLRIPGESGT